MRTMKRPFLFGVALLFSLGCHSCWNRRVPTIPCDELSMTVLPGTCVTVTNPCGDHQWLDLPRVDGFEFCHIDRVGIAMAADRTGDRTVRQVCVGSLVEGLVDEPIAFQYGRGNEIGTGTLRLSTVGLPVVSAAASPATIDTGGISHLEASVTDGLPPYTYAWTPAAGLSATNVRNPDAMPDTTTEYTVTVFDAGGQTASASLTVTVAIEVRPSIIVAANPRRINQYESSQLSVGGLTGIAPFTFEWSPAATLNSPSSAAPIATPEETTTYAVRVTDSTGATVSGAATVIVNLSLFADAVPRMINQGATTQLFVVAQGGLAPYVYQWAPVATVSDPTSAFPTATPTSTTTYSVAVTDALGAAASETVIVFVAPTGGGGPAGAPFAFTYDGVGTIALDAAESASGSVRFEWDFSWVPGNPDLQTTNPQATWAAPPGTTGTITLTVTDAAGLQRSTTTAFP